MEELRLQKIIANRGLCSRRKAEELILDGKVKVNGKVVTEMGLKFPENVKIEIEGLSFQNVDEKKVTYVFNKPLGVLSSASDDRGRKCVVDFFKKEPYRVFPVGRLDFNTSGCLLVSNDGELANLVCHPSSHLEKIYIVTVEAKLSMDDFRKLHEGVMLEDGITQPAKIILVKQDDDVTIFKIGIHEGRNRQVRRMVEAIGYQVKSLFRESVDIINVNGLKRGEYRLLTQKEVDYIKAKCKAQKEKNVIPESKRKNNI